MRARSLWFMIGLACAAKHGVYAESLMAELVARLASRAAVAP